MLAQRSLNRRHIIVSALVFLICCKQNSPREPYVKPSENAGNHPVREFARTITAADLKKHIEFLASDRLEGRHTGSRGGKEAADFIAGHFRDLDLRGIPFQDNPYLQNFRIVKKKPLECYLESQDGRIENWKDFMEMHCDFSGEKTVGMVFAGFGRESEFDRIVLTGKLVAFFVGNQDSDEVENALEQKKIDAALSRGAAGTLLIADDDKELLDYIEKIRPYLNVARFYRDLPPHSALEAKRNIVTTSTAAALLFGMTPDKFRALKDSLRKRETEGNELTTTIRMKSSFELGESLNAANALGWIEGTDLKDQCVILTAHYDHLGKEGEKIHNGAYDNAAGVSALMEIAAAFMSACNRELKPRRSVVFLMPDAEELGGSGSMHYLDNPIFPAHKTSADINIDGIGREDASRPELKNFAHVYLSKNGRQDLAETRDKAVRALSSKLNLEMRESYNGSDHVFFEQRLIPAFAFSTGHPRDHHKPSDTADKLDYDNVRDIARLAFAVAWELAHSDTAIPRVVSK